MLDRELADLRVVTWPRRSYFPPARVVTERDMMMVLS